MHVDFWPREELIYFQCMHVYSSILMSWADSAAVWTDSVPETIHNQVDIELLVSGLLTGHICYVFLFLHDNRFYIYILISSVLVLSF